MAVTPRKRASPAVRSSVMSKQLIQVPDPDFHDFDCTRTTTDIKPGQIWAIYDDKDGIDITVRLVAFPSVHLRMSMKEQFVPGASARLKIYPREEEVWAMYQDWDQVPLTGDTPSNVKCKFEIVEILVDYSKKNGVKSVKLERVPGFRTVFRRKDDPQAVHVWRNSDLLKFSHNVPAVKIQENKLIGIPNQALELDPAAIPIEFSEVDDRSGDVEMRPQPAQEVYKDTGEGLNEAEHTPARPSRHRQRQQKPAKDINLSTLALSQGNAKSLELDSTDHSVIELEQFDLRPKLQETFSSALVSSTFRSHSELSALQTQQTGSEVDFYDFDSLRTETDIEPGAIWATYDTNMDKMPRTYVRVVQVLQAPSKSVEIWRLQSRRCSEKMQSRTDRTGLAISCGTFEDDKRDVIGIENFSHLVSIRDKKWVKIYPRKGEVWAMYRNWDLESGIRRKAEALGTVHSNGYELVEILADFLGEGTLEILRLVKVTGFKSLFQRQGKPVVNTSVRPDFMFEFSHSIPARKMYKDDTLGIPLGALEVDPACLLPVSFTDERDKDNR